MRESLRLESPGGRAKQERSGRGSIHSPLDTIRLAMPRIGLHVRSKGSFQKTAERAAELGAETFQIFSSSPRMWKAKPTDPADAAACRQICAERGLRPLVIHANYLINPAATDEEIRRRSIAALRGELERAVLLGAAWVVVHPGSGTVASREQALDHAAASLREVVSSSPGPVGLLLENTAGQGACLGHRFEELAELYRRVAPRAAIETGYCLDTAHCLAAGYDISTEAGARDTLTLADSILGLERVRAIHANDSKTPAGSRVDRHEQIGKGFVGDAAFQVWLSHPAFSGHPFLLEVPFEAEGDEVRNMERLRRLAAPPPPKAAQSLKKIRRR